jgi:hypothetical protein
MRCTSDIDAIAVRLTFPYNLDRLTQEIGYWRQWVDVLVCFLLGEDVVMQDWLLPRAVAIGTPVSYLH